MKTNINGTNISFSSFSCFLMKKAILEIFPDESTLQLQFLFSKVLKHNIISDVICKIFGIINSRKIIILDTNKTI